MDVEQAKDWAKNKANQETTLQAFFRDNKPKKGKIAFFMAGIPGAGKTEFTERTIREASPELISVEHDKLVEYIDGYTPETYYNYRKAGSILVTRVFSECIKNSYAFVFDGTLSHQNGMRNIKKCLANDYSVIVVYLVQSAAKAWELTQAREIVKKRAIEKEGFIETCNKINANLVSILDKFKEHDKFSFWLIDKQGEQDMKMATAIIHSPSLNKAGEIEKALQKNYNTAIGN